jgi:hypothetical protein
MHASVAFFPLSLPPCLTGQALDHRRMATLVEHMSKIACV